MNYIDENGEEKEIKEKPQEASAEMKIPEDSVLARLVAPHELKSRQVTKEDIDCVVNDSKILYEICFTVFGPYHGAYAMHHSQIDAKDPLNFFVTADRQIIINPVITRHTNYTVDSKEGCVTFPNSIWEIVPRWHKIEVEYITIMSDPDNEGKFKFSNVIAEDWSGKDAKIFQHEFDHGEGKYIYTQDKIKD